MKSLKTIVVVLTILLMTGFAEARGRSHSRTRGKHKTTLQGTVLTLGTSGFVLSVGSSKSHPSSSAAVTASSTLPAGLKVLCDANTKFMHGGVAVKSTELKEGMRVAVEGPVFIPGEIQATTVTIDPPAEKHKSKKKK